jgi:putative ABC transport system permease protein
MRIWSLAGRNLRRNPRRSLATLLALAIGGAALLLFGGYVANIRYSLESVYVRNGGHFQIQHRDFFLYGSGNPTGYGIEDYDRILKAIHADDVLSRMVLVATPVLHFLGIASNDAANVSRTVIGKGQVAADVRRMREWNELNIRLGPELPPFRLDGASEDAGIIGVGLARVLLLCEELHVPNCAKPRLAAATPGAALPEEVAALADSVVPAAPGRVAGQAGARIDVLVGQPRGSPNVAAINVIAAEGQGFKEADEVLLMVQLAQAQRLVYGRSAPKVTAIMVQLKRTADIPVAAARLRAVLERVNPKSELTVLDFGTLNPFYVQSIQLFDTIFWFIFLLIGCIVLFTVGNTMMAAVVERTVEVGTLRAIGVRRNGIRAIFLCEGFLLGVAGGVAGGLLALCVAWFANSLDLTWQPPGTAEPLPLNIRIWGEGRMLLVTVAGLVVIATLSAWLPAYRAARTKIVDALRHV